MASPVLQGAAARSRSALVRLLAERGPQDTRLLPGLDQRFARIALARLELARLLAAVEASEIGMRPSHTALPGTGQADPTLRYPFAVAARLMSFPKAILPGLVDGPVTMIDHPPAIHTGNRGWSCAESGAASSKSASSRGMYRIAFLPQPEGQHAAAGCL